MSLSRQTITLSKTIVAMAFDSTESGTPYHTCFAQLPAGTELRVVGAGFNDKTAKVRCRDRSYFVFWRDVEEPDSSYYLP